MYFYSKLKKTPIILSSAIITLSGISFSAFATGNLSQIELSPELPNQEITERPLPTKITRSKSLSSLETSSFRYTDTFTEQEIESPPEFFVEPINQELFEDSTPKKITLNKPGNYKLVGVNTHISNYKDSNIILVNTGDCINIKGSGKYNVVLDNVNIDMQEKVDGYISPLNIKDGANVDLTLVGYNKLESNLQSSEGIYVDYTSKLTITKESAGASLDALGSDYAIIGTNITVKGGTITAGGECGILAFDRVLVYNSNMDDILNPTAYFIVDGGEIRTSKLEGENIIINDGEAWIDEIIVKEKFEINDGTINTYQINYSPDDGHSGIMIINGGTLEMNKNLDNSESDGIYLQVIKINDGIIDTTELRADKSLEINGGAVIASDKIYSQNILIKDGHVKTDILYGEDHLKIEGRNVYVRQIIGPTNQGIIL